ncbi:DNA alkylation repair protein [Candidatus Uhrbacteria bacterium CG22_combo_CG10-13_8_21_14_all_47_17]|uniref:DNA alkylation repair protein n=1 Tax=Candidatus Uhrbacteria bacterium CG22_combo_CG10-13_8_21_14_all_47_17 TaxID=1975041 RepID=A0A2H0BRB3_9BACT|nr:MAG: DNA alkylation repair protein [Candidatus Uhrbacteria bacterium CG22_combo_CG10-13_8_21_14_all_47_17]
MSPSSKLSSFQKELHALADQDTAQISSSFFKTGPGEYGEKDRFLGIRVPKIRAIAKKFQSFSLQDIEALLNSSWHEERLAGVIVLVETYKKASKQIQAEIFRFYLNHVTHINNWDLVDVSAPTIVGGSLLHSPRKTLDVLAASKNIWERRIAIVSTLAFIRENDFKDTLRISELLLQDTHDLMHKACGWMLREVYKRSPYTLETFLKAHAEQMPRTMLRYAIERMPERQRKSWLRVKTLPKTKTLA